jgi:hypothetical protein
LLSSALPPPGPSYLGSLPGFRLEIVRAVPTAKRYSADPEGADASPKQRPGTNQTTCAAVLHRGVSRFASQPPFGREAGKQANRFLSDGIPVTLVIRPGRPAASAGSAPP